MYGVGLAGVIFYFQIFEQALIRSVYLTIFISTTLYSPLLIYWIHRVFDWRTEMDNLFCSTLTQFIQLISPKVNVQIL